jgi:hypothetical protein
METMFHSQDQWKSAMMTLPDDVFFDLLRSVFGPIKTPFNKQNLLMELAAFLSREDIRRNLAAYIDESDAQVITAVAALGEPSAGDLEQFFAEDGEFSTLLLSLEERLLLYRFREGENFRLALNPVLAPVLRPIAEDPLRIFPSFPLQEDPEDLQDSSLDTAESGWKDDRIFAALLSFFLGEGGPFESGGRRRKKVLDSGKRIFPGTELETAYYCFLRLGLIRNSAGPEGEVLIPEKYALEAFQDLTPRSRFIYWAAGLAAAGNETNDPFGETPASQLLRGRIRRLAKLTGGMLSLLEGGRVYPVKTLSRFLFMLVKEENTASLAPPLEFPDIHILCGALVKTGLLRQVSQGYTLPEESSEEQTIPILTMDAPLFCLLYPGVDFADALALASFTAVRETGAVFRFELTRESCLRGFEQGIGAVEMEKLLARLSGDRVESSVFWTLEDWEKRSREVALFEGTVLVLAPERRYLAETDALAALIRRELAPGLYLLFPEARAAEVLRKAGIEVISHSPGPERENSSNGRVEGRGPFQRTPGSHYLFSPLGKGPDFLRIGAGKIPGTTLDAAGAAEAADQDAEVLKDHFRKILAGRSLSANERNELAVRIERRLVLMESQLSADSLRAEKLEARGLDYVGKASIARQAVSSHSLLEIVWSSQEGEQRILAFPLGLEKSGGESILAVEDSRVPGDMPKNTIRIPLGKISLLRRIRKSIFEM